MLKRLKDQILAQSRARVQAESYRNLIRREAKIGGQLFGAVPKNHRRDFFCLDEHTWIWYEEWVSKTGKKESRTTRYDVRPSGVVKIQDNAGYQALSPSEAKNLKSAINLYQKRVLKELYGIA